MMQRAQAVVGLGIAFLLPSGCGPILGLEDVERWHPAGGGGAQAGRAGAPANEIAGAPVAGGSNQGAGGAAGVAGGAAGNGAAPDSGGMAGIEDRGGQPGGGAGGEPAILGGRAGAGGEPVAAGGSAGEPTTNGGVRSSGGTAGEAASPPGGAGGEAAAPSGGAGAAGAATGGAEHTGGVGAAPGGGSGGDVTAGAGGTTGGTATGGTVAIDPGVFAPDLDGFLWEGTCDGAGSDNRQCAINNDNGSRNNNVIRDVTKSVHGTAGNAYIMEVEVRGLLGSRCYCGGIRRAGATPVDWTGPNDGLYIGGTVPTNWWNTYEVHVNNGPPGKDSVFYLNCYYDNQSPTIEFDNQTCTMEEVLEVGYTFEIPVMGNSSIVFRLNDQNCQAQMNCGTYAGVRECPLPRSVDLTGMDPPATFIQPLANTIGGRTYYPQWAYFDVKSVREM